MNRGLPPLDLRPRPAHLFRLIDLALIALIFLIAGRTYMNTKGAERLEDVEAQRAQALDQAVIAQAQADSVVAAAEVVLQQATADSAQWAQELSDRLAGLDAASLEQQQLAQEYFRLYEAIPGQRGSTLQAQAELRNLEKDVRLHSGDIAGLGRELEVGRDSLASAQQTAQLASAELNRVQRLREYDPASRFPSRSGMMLSREVGDEQDVRTMAELQHNLARAGGFDVGVAAGLGFAEGQSSAKQVGLLVTKLLVHRRLSLDAGAGYSILTDAEGDDDSSPYGSIGIRYSPFYREHFHLGLGARANSDEVMPYIGIGFGRR